MEASDRPVDAKWLDDDTIVLLRKNGFIEIVPLGPNARSYSLVLENQVQRLCRLPASNRIVLVTNEKLSQVHFEADRLVLQPLDCPLQPGEIAALSETQQEQILAIDKEGKIHRRREAQDWEIIGEAAIKDISSAWDLKTETTLLFNTHGEVETLSAFGLKGRRMQRLHSDAVQQAVAYGGESVLTVSRDRSLRAWHFSEGFQLEWSIPSHHSHFINCVVVLGDQIWTSCSDGFVKRTKYGERKSNFSVKVHEDAIRVLEASPSGRRILCVSDDGMCSIFDTELERVERKFGQTREYIRSAKIRNSSEGPLILAGTTTGTLIKSQPNKGSLHRERLSQGALRAIASLDSREIVVASEIGELFLLQEVGAAVRSNAEIDVGITSCVPAGTGNQVYVGFRNGSVSLIELLCESDDVLSIGLESTKNIHGSIVGDIAFSPDGFLLTCSDDHSIAWSIPETLEKVRVTTPNHTAVNNLVFIGDLVLGTTDGGRVHVVENFSGQTLRTFVGHQAPVRAISHLWGNVVATGDKSGIVLFWDIENAEILHREQFSERVIDLTFDPDTDNLHLVTEAEIATITIDRGEIHANSEAQLNASSAGANASMLSSSSNSALDDRNLFSSVELSKRGANFTLNPVEQLLLRRFALQRGGVRCDLSQLGGGLSGAHVFHVRVFDEYGTLRINAVAKIGGEDEIRLEAENYDREISRLPARATPRKLELDSVISEGSEAWGVFYSLASEFERPIFSLSSAASSALSRSVLSLSKMMSAWSDGVPETRIDVANVRRGMINDEDARRIRETYDLAWIESFELELLQVRICTTHGDLHGENILVDGRGGVAIIDYGDVARRPASIDPITLELSHFFHPSQPLSGSNWPSGDQATKWGTAAYLKESPSQLMVDSCRLWALDVSAGQREIAACAYSYLLRQLKYPDTDKGLALKLLEGARNLFFET